MKRVPILIACLLALAALAFRVPDAGAFPQYSQNRDATNCRECHGDFRASPYTSLANGQSWGDDLHDVHRNTMLNGDCNTCHSSGALFPVIIDTSAGGTGLQAISCVGCHGRTEDGGNDNVSGGLGAGLRQHHWSAGITTCGAAGCHTDANPATYTAVGENVPPPYYANPGTNHPNMPTNPCNTDGSENFAATAEGLDNDGDNIYDGADPDCQQVPGPGPDIAVSPASLDFGSVTVGTSSTREVTIANAGTDNLSVAGIILDNTAIDNTYALDLDGGANPCLTGTLNAPTVAMDNAETGAVSDGTGTADIQYDSATNLLSWNIAYSGLTGPLTVAHFHGPAGPGDNAAVQVPITVGPSPLVGSATITNAQEADLLSGLYYVNLHTGAYPDGEIRGQVVFLPREIEAGDNCTVAVTFTPPAAGPSTATLTVTSDDADELVTTVPVTGSGATPTPPPLIGDGDDGCSVVGRSGGTPGGIGPYVLLALAGLKLAFRRSSRSKGGRQLPFRSTRR